MRRWNGWGDEAETYPLSAEARRYLAEHLGAGAPPSDARLDQVVRAVPASRLPGHPLLRADPETRLRRARGQSLPDWIALRSSRVGRVPDAVAFPENDVEVIELLRFARGAGATVIPYGGGTSVVGHLTPDPDGPPVLTVDLRNLWRLHRLDEESLLASVGAGVRGPDLEAQLRTRGYTLGHYPQSFEYSSLGGWVVTRSKGQESLGYGRIEDLFAGGRLQSPAGPGALGHRASAGGGGGPRRHSRGPRLRARVAEEPLPHALFWPARINGTRWGLVSA